MNKLEFLKWLKRFIKDKEVLSEIELLEIEEAISNIKLDDICNVTIIAKVQSPIWNKTMTENIPIFKNPYNYEITKMDKKPNKK